MATRSLQFLTALLSLGAAACSEVAGPATPIAEPAEASFSTAAPVQGEWIRTAGYPTAALYTDGVLYFAPDMRTVEVCTGNHPSLVRTVDRWPVASTRTLPSAAQHGWMSGTRPLASDNGNPTVYQLVGCVLAGVPSPAVYQAVFSAAPNDWSAILRVPDYLLRTLPQGPLARPFPNRSAGTAIRGSGDLVKVLVGPSRALGVPSADVFLSHGYGWGDVRQVSAAEFSTYAQVAVLHRAGGASPQPPLGSPRITGVDGSKWYWDKAPKYPNFFYTEYYAGAASQAVDSYVLTVNGADFGSTQGSVSLSNPDYRVVRIVSWTPTRVRVLLAPRQLRTAPARVTLTLRRPDGRSGSIQVPLIPSVRTRVYGQCTWWVALRRLETGRLEPRPIAYSATGVVNARYVPQAGDVLHWSGTHTGFVESVEVRTALAPKGGTIYTYTVRISQYNARYDEAYSAYTTVVQVREYRNSAGQAVRELVSGGYRFSANSAGATAYYR